MASNELMAFASLQPPSTPEYSDSLCKLLGAFLVGKLGAAEQWLVLRNDGVYTADQYAQQAAQAFAEARAVGEGEFWDRMSPERPLLRRRVMVTRVLRGALRGLGYMHAQGWLHQSLGPTSVTLDSVDEAQSRFLKVRLRDLAFAVDVRDTTLRGGGTLGELWERGSEARAREPDPRQELAGGLWARARDQGAYSPEERRQFGMADDVYSAGLLVLYLSLVPFARPGDADGAQLQRLVEGTFRLDLDAFR